MKDKENEGLILGNPKISKNHQNNKSWGPHAESNISYYGGDVIWKAHLEN